MFIYFESAIERIIKLLENFILFYNNGIRLMIDCFLGINYTSICTLDISNSFLPLSMSIVIGEKYDY